MLQQLLTKPPDVVFGSQHCLMTSRDGLISMVWVPRSRLKGKRHLITSSYYSNPGNVRLMHRRDSLCIMFPSKPARGSKNFIFAFLCELFGTLNPSRRSLMSAVKGTQVQIALTTTDDLAKIEIGHHHPCHSSQIRQTQS